jgi:AcrR family transcriptional regulator
MSSVADEASRRPHDAQASRRDLLRAAAELFAERDYGGATVREIGERAGVDPALIARYFGGKEGLYLAALAESAPTDLPAEPDALLRAMLCRPAHKRTSPVMRALVNPALTDAMRDQIRAVLDTRAVGPVAAALKERGVPRARLRAELLIALMLGVSLTRANGTLEALAEADGDELLETLGPVAEALTGYATSSAA